MSGACGGASERIAVPILPPSCASMPAEAARCAVNAVVVDLPLVPVMAMKGAACASRRRSRQNSSMSPITGTPALCASSTVQCGFGCVSGTPGASTSAAILVQSIACKSAIGMPAASAFLRLSAVSSEATTSAPPAMSARALTRPEPPKPNTATFRPARVATGITENYRSFKVESPASASTTATIQKRMTICGSVQPSCSK